MPLPNELLKVQLNFEHAHFCMQLQLEIPVQGIIFLFGPSGSGKTSLLRAIAGLDCHKNGHITFKGEVWQNVNTHLAPHKRAVGYVFQEASLFSHLTVAQNLDYGWKRNKARANDISPTQVIDWLGLTPLLNLYNEQLSGGQRQRVAIGRALLSNPQLLLMDEPLAGLDDSGKNEILPYLETLHQKLGIPIIYVSHALEEVLRLADHIVLLDKGQLVGSGPVNQILTDPDLPLAQLNSSCAIIRGKVKGHDDQFHLSQIQLAAGIISLPKQFLAIGHPINIRIQAQDVSLTLNADQDTSINNILPATIIDTYPSQNPAHTFVRLNLNGDILLARITRRSYQHLALQEGMTVFAQIKTVALAKLSY